VALHAQSPRVRLITGVVADSSGAVVPYARVELAGLPRATTDDSGRFVVADAPRGTVQLGVRRIGFSPLYVRLPERSDTTIRLTMAHAARTLEAARIVAMAGSRTLELHGFYRRMAERERGAGSGFFLTSEDIERRNPIVLSQLLRGFPSVRLVNMGRDYYAAGVDGCPMTIYLDRIRLRAPGGDGPILLDYLLQPHTLAGIEVYARPTAAPMEYQYGTCGIVMMWTR
jgi:hypothetical protein